MAVLNSVLCELVGRQICERSVGGRNVPHVVVADSNVCGDWRHFSTSQ